MLSTAWFLSSELSQSSRRTAPPGTSQPIVPCRRHRNGSPCVKTLLARGFLTDMAHGIIDGGTAVETCVTGTGSTQANACGAKATPVPHVNR